MSETMVSVRFVHDFAPYSIKAGQNRMVSVAVADKLLNEYGVIEPYGKPTSRIVMVRVVKNLSRVYPGWWPGSVQLADTSIMASYISDGSIQVMEGAEYKPDAGRWGNIPGTREGGSAGEAGSTIPHDEVEVRNRFGKAFTVDGVIRTYLAGSAHNGSATREYMERAVSLIVQDPALARQIVGSGIESSALIPSDGKIHSITGHDDLSDVSEKTP